MSASALLLAVRAASINLCTDEYLLLLAKPHEIATVSYLAQDPLESRLWRIARPHHANYGSVEQILQVRPTLLLTMGGGGRASRRLAQSMKVRIVPLRPAMSVADVSYNLATVADALGDRRRAQPWLARLRKLRESRPAAMSDAIFLTGGGATITAGSAGAEWLRLAGLKQRDLPEGRATLETLLLRPPNVLIESNYRRGQVSAAQRWLGHPIVRRLQSRRLTADGRAWTCLGPMMIPEIERLRRRRP